MKKKSAEFKIRRAKFEDIKILRAMAARTKEVLDTTGYVEREAKFRSLIRQGIVLVAESDSAIAGFLLADVDVPADASLLIYLVVRPKYRGMGIGRALFKEYLKRCKARRVKYIDTYAPSFNKRAVRFYEKMGMKKGQKWIYFSKILR